LESGLADVVLIDIEEGTAKGKSEDLMDAASIIGHNRSIAGGSDYRMAKDSDIIIITAGFARKPGMSREELLVKNASVVSDVTAQCMRFNKEPIIIVVTNPLDIMAYLAHKKSALGADKVIGMAGILDSSRMNLIAARYLKKDLGRIDSMVLGTHGKTMVPIMKQSKLEGKAMADHADKDLIEVIKQKTKDRGAEIVSYLGSGSAFYAPSAGVFKMVKAIAEDTKEILPCSCMLNGEYGISGIYLGVPAKIGRRGVEEIIEFPLGDDESSGLKTACESVRKQIESLK
jgi:malate dehydrogenase